MRNALQKHKVNPEAAKKGNKSKEVNPKAVSAWHQSTRALGLACVLYNQCGEPWHGCSNVLNSLSAKGLVGFDQNRIGRI